MADIELGKTYVEIQARMDRLESDFKRAESSAKKSADKMENSFKSASLRFHDSLAKKSLSEIEVSAKKLRTNLEKQIKMNMPLERLEATKSSLDKAENALRTFRGEQEKPAKSTTGLFNTAAVLGFIYMVKRAGEAIIQLGLEGARLENLRAAFRGTEGDLQNFRQATAGTVNDASLLKLSNQADALGVSLEKQVLLFALAEDSGDKMGVGVEEAFNKIVLATEGNTRGLKEIGIQKKIYEQTVNDLAKAYDVEIEKLDAETQKQIRLEAVIKASGITMADVTNKAQDHADKIESVGVAWENVKNTIGKAVAPAIGWVLTNFAEGLQRILGLTDDVDKAFKNMAGTYSQAYRKSFEGTTKEFRESETVKTQKDITVKQTTFNVLHKTAYQLESEPMGTVRNAGQIKAIKEEMDLLRTQLSQLRLYRTELKNFKEENKPDFNIIDPSAGSEKSLNVVEQISSNYKKLNDDLILVSNSLDAINKKESLSVEDEYKKNELLKKRIEIMKQLEEPYVLKLQIIESKKTEIESKKINYNIPGQLAGVNKGGGVNPLEGFDAESVLESWVGESEIAGAAIDGFINGAIDGFDRLKVTIGNDMSFATRFVNTFANSALQAIESIIAKWAVLNIISFAAGGPGVGLLSMLGLASGGPVSSNTPYIVGEKGPELFVPNSAGYIVPNNILNRSSVINNFSNDNSALLTEMKLTRTAIRTMNLNLQDKDFEPKIDVNIDGKTLTRLVTTTLNKLVKTGFNKNDF